MPHDEINPTEGEFVGKETAQEPAVNVTHITNNVVIQQMDVYTDKLAQTAELIDEASMLSIDDELSQHASMDLDARLNRYFKGKVVRKDLTKQLKEGANVPVYVLEYLLGMYCASDDDEVVREGLENVKKILAENYVRPDEAEKVKSLIRERGSFKVIDKIGVKLNQKKDVYEAQLSNLGIKDAVIPASIVKANEKLLTGGSGASLLLTIFMKRAKNFALLNFQP
jgi:ATP-dependent Lon protease